MLRVIFNHGGPFVGGSGLVQEGATAPMSQLALSYRDGPLSANHPHGGTLHAGDRVPDLQVRHRTRSGGAEARLQELLDPSGFVPLVAHGADGDTLNPVLRDAASAACDDILFIELTPSAAPPDREHYEAELGRPSVFLVWPDG